MIESMPIESDEQYSFHNNEKSGVILSFQSLVKNELESGRFR